MVPKPELGNQRAGDVWGLFTLHYVISAKSWR